MNDKAYKFSTRDSTEFTVGDGSALPEVTSEDNGDVLTVVEGSWAKATPAGGSGGVMIVEIDTSMDEGSGDFIYTSRSTLQEIADAMDAGTPVFAKYNFSDDNPGQFHSMSPMHLAVSDTTRGKYFVIIEDFGSLVEGAIMSVKLSTDSPNGYPTNDESAAEHGQPLN